VLDSTEKSVIVASRLVACVNPAFPASQYHPLRAVFQILPIAAPFQWTR